MVCIKARYNMSLLDGGEELLSSGFYAYNFDNNKCVLPQRYHKKWAIEIKMTHRPLQKTDIV